jgi:hypothetical protein
VIPGPRPSKGHDRPRVGRDRGREVVRPLRSDLSPEAAAVSSGCERAAPAEDGSPEPPPVALVRTSRGWSVVGPTGTEHAGDLVEGLSLADLVAEEFGVLTEPDRTARRSARGGGAQEAEDPADARMAALERTVTQLEHALAARVSTERAIGVLAERHGSSARTAFETLRRDARSQGRPVAELAREVLDGLSTDPAAARPPDDAAGTEPSPAAPATGSVPAPGLPRRGAVAVTIGPLAPPAPRVPSVAGSAGSPAGAAADGRS